MGLAAAAADPTTLWQEPAARWFTLERVAAVPAAALAAPRSRRRAPCVVDLSSLWAGPLCSHLLQRLGARVIKLESRQRPDGARQGTPEFFDLLHAGKESVVLDFDSAAGRQGLRALLAQADIVIEASRPRALRQLGIDAEQLLAEQPGLTWLSLTGHGRQPPQDEWIAYGDDAGVAAGLSGVMLALTGQPLFCGDAIADPLSGWHAALAALAGWQGGGGLYALSLVEVVRHCAQFALPATPAALRERWQEWQALLAEQGIEQGHGQPCGQAHGQTPGQENARTPGSRDERAPGQAWVACLPGERRPSGKARPLGADTRRVLGELAGELLGAAGAEMTEMATGAPAAAATSAAVDGASGATTDGAVGAC
jgi:hypothetical protein